MMEIEKLKTLLGLDAKDDSQDIALQFVLDNVRETILNYCNLETLPEGLRNTALRMAVDLWRSIKPGTDEIPLVVSSLSEGDISTSFGRADTALQDGVLKSYRGQLNAYRKLRK